MKTRILNFCICIITAAAITSVAVETARADETPTYVGAEKCKMCHLGQYKTWKETPMAKTWERVAKAKDKKLCYSCHTTGYGKPGGFVSIEETPDLVGIQCEVCHGPGGEHTSLPIKEKDPEIRKSTINKAVQDCRTCHSPHVSDKAAKVREAAGKKEE